MTTLREIVALQVGLRRLDGDRRAARLPAADRRTLVRGALTIGREAAHQVQARHGNLTVGRLAAALGVAVEESWEEGGWGSVTVFADYTPRPPKATLYLRAIGGLQRLLRSADLRPAFLAHELFHHWEGQHPELAPARRLRIPAWSLGPLRRTTALASLSEIAADAFAEELLGARHPAGLREALTD
ncbi:MAG: hypothetical protein U1E23_03255 [Reyranellaceae bacterium]